MADGTVKEVEVPYDIPDSWEWVKLKEIALVKSSKRVLQKDYAKSGIPFYRSKEIGNLHRNEDIITELFITDEHYQTLQDSYGVPKQGDILITSVGSIGNTWICDERKFYYKDGNITQICSNEYFNSYFIERCIHSPFFWEQVTSTVSGTAYSALTIIKLNNILFPLPPLSEQKRIVEQIERALEKVDAYSESYNKLQELDKSFPDKLKKSILQYAMQGKLVPQDPNDEPVEVLLEKIQTEKQKLYEEGKLKKKDLAEIVVTKGDDNSPYGNNKENSDIACSTMPEIPNSWSYVRFGGIVLFNIGKTPPRSEPTYWGVDIPWVSISDMPNSGYITKTKECISHLAIKQTNIKIVPADTLLMSFKLSIGKVAILDVPASHNEAIISIFPYSDKKNIIRNYLMMFLPLISTAGNSKDAIKGKTLNSTSISELLIPISNYQEMKKIVSKVDLLFQKVAQLYD
ncbi:TPA: restriction endonuclease subunit S [Streptococcus suis]|nr:restriction endonuclease subunit S [Streptococcus suis]